MQHVKLYEDFKSSQQQEIDNNKFLSKVKVKYPEHYQKIGFTLQKSGLEAAQAKLDELVGKKVSLDKGRPGKDPNATAGDSSLNPKTIAKKERHVENSSKWIPEKLDIKDYASRISEFVSRAQYSLDQAKDSGVKNDIIAAEGGLKCLETFFTTDMFKLMNEGNAAVCERYNTQFDENVEHEHAYDRIDPYFGKQIDYNDEENKTDKNGVIFQDLNTYASSRFLRHPAKQIEYCYNKKKFGTMSILMYDACLAAGKPLRIKDFRKVLSIYTGGKLIELEIDDEE